MTDMDLPNNSNKAKRQAGQERPQLKPVVQHGVVRRKTPLGKKFKQAFVNEDAQSVGQFIVMDVLVPMVKDLLFEVVTQGLGRRLYGDVPRRPGNRFAQGPIQGPNGVVSYNLMSGGPQRLPSPSIGGMRAFQPDGPNTAMTAQGRANHNFDQLKFLNRGEADLVLERLNDVLSSYTMVTVSELYELIGEPKTPIDNKWGWFSLAGSGVQSTHGGWILNLPKPVPLD